MSVVVRELSREFDNSLVVRGLSFEVPQGSLFALLGTNGAGKTTTIRCLTTALLPSSGQAIVAGVDVISAPNRVRQSIGVVFQNSLLDPMLTVRENLVLRAVLYGLSRVESFARIEELSSKLDLTETLDSRYGKLSGGQKRRADIARALVHAPAVVFLDEPTAGLDTEARENVWSTVESLRHEQQLTVFLTTHYLAETEQADCVCLMDHGTIQALGTPHDLRQQYSAYSLVIYGPSLLDLGSWLTDRRLEFARVGDGLSVTIGSAQEAVQVLSALTSTGPTMTDFEFRRGNMDDVFLSLSRVTQEEE